MKIKPPILMATTIFLSAISSPGAAMHSTSPKINRVKSMQQDEVFPKMFSKKHLKDPEKLCECVHLIIDDGRFSSIQIIKNLGIALESIGLSINSIISNYGKTAVYYAAEKGYKQTFNVLLMACGDDKWHVLTMQESHRQYTPLHIAVINGNTDIVETICSYAGPNVWKLILMQEHHGWTTLHLAAWHYQDIFHYLAKFAEGDDLATLCCNAMWTELDDYHNGD